MSFQVSPGINVSEIDLTAGVVAPSTTDGAFAGAFRWGPANEVQLVVSEDDLAQRFGTPDNDTALFFFTAVNFLQYGNKLRLVRVVDGDRALNATADFETLTGTVTANSSSNTIVGVGTNFSVELSVGRKIRIGAAGDILTVGSITNTTQFTTTSVPAANASANTLHAAGKRIDNETVYTENFANGLEDVGPWAAKYPGSLGNSLKVSICASGNAYTSTPTGTVSGNTTSNVVTGVGTSFTTQVVVGDVLNISGDARKVTSITNTTQLTVNTALSALASGASFTRSWEFATLFDGAPGSSEYVNLRAGSADEMHLVVIDEDGLWTGTPGTVLETYAFVSKASDAKLSNGQLNYYKEQVNRRSRYLWWMGHITAGTNWGSASANTAFVAPYQPVNHSLLGAVDSNDQVGAADLVSGYDQFLSTEEVDISLVIAPPFANTAVGNAVANHIVSNLCESRLDCVAFISPPQPTVVDNANQEAADIITFRNGLPSSSYAFMDSGWKYQLDKYNDVYRWIPLCGDVAGLASRTDRVADPWYSPAGFVRGNIKNVVKLAFNPNKAERDDLYRNGINPVTSPTGQGTVLFGDKTMLNRPSAFDRINVRRLFIVLEKTISRAAQGTLFEFNDEVTRGVFVNLVEPFLREVKARRGITDFRVICDETNNTPEVIDSNKFRGDIYIKPTRSINFVQLNFVAVRTGVTFEEIVNTTTEL